MKDICDIAIIKGEKGSHFLPFSSLPTDRDFDLIKDLSELEQSSSDIVREIVLKYFGIFAEQRQPRDLGWKLSWVLESEILNRF